MANSRVLSISENPFSIRPGVGDGSALNPENFLQRIRNDANLMENLAKIDRDLHEVVQENNTDALQRLLKSRHACCHCRSISRFNCFLVDIHQTEVHKSLKEKLAKYLHGSRRYFFDDRVVKIYIKVEVNSHTMEAFICSGSRSSIISRSKAAKCGLLKSEHEPVINSACLVRCHNCRPCITCDIKIGKTFHTCRFMVVDSCDVGLSFGLDILNELECVIDLNKHVLKVGNEEVRIHLFKDPPPEVTSKEASVFQGMEDSSADFDASGRLMGALSLRSEDGCAERPVEFVQYIRENSELLAKLFKIPKLAEAVEGDDINVLQRVLRGLHCDCSHCISLYAYQHSKELERFEASCEAARLHICTHLEEAVSNTKTKDDNIARPHTRGPLVMPYVNMTVGFGLKCEVLVDTGAQSTVTSEILAEQCGLLPYLRRCYEICGDSLKILGQVHYSFVKINERFLHCPVFVVDSTDIEFVLGLDMLCELKCTLDFKDKILKVGDDVKASQRFNYQEGKYDIDHDCILGSRKRQKVEMQWNVVEDDSREAKIQVLEKIYMATRDDAEKALKNVNWLLADSPKELVRLCTSRVSMIKVAVPVPHPNLDIEWSWNSDSDSPYSDSGLGSGSEY